MSGIREPKGILPYSPENYPEKLPDFSTEEELRDFFDTHDSSYYWDQFEDVTDFPPPDLLMQVPGAPRVLPARYSRPKKELLSIRFPSEMIEGIKTIAERRHIPYQTLLRSWVGERLDQELAAINDERAEKKAS